MSSPTPVESSSVAPIEQDVVESIVPYIPVVIPLVGAVLIFLLATIAVTMG